jgi:hypothetical protein
MFPVPLPPLIPEPVGKALKSVVTAQHEGNKAQIRSRKDYRIKPVIAKKVEFWIWFFARGKDPGIQV